jgi:hypothetical protein
MTAKLSFLKGITPEFKLETYKLKERIRTHPTKSSIE